MDFGPQIWVLEANEKALMPEVLPGAGDEARDVFGDIGPIAGVFGGGPDPRTPLTFDEAGNALLPWTGGLYPVESEPLVLPAEQADDLPEPDGLFAWTRVDGAGPFTLTMAENGSFLAGSGPGDPGRDGWLF